ncbi:MAG TPA: alkene reductase [Kofleriaceae bacterium]|jgi:N-ethylmaleimide reductase|nr:alkene reductase [Kofleriaceae bacterium]
MTSLFSPFKYGRLTLPNRIVMSPMTRSRAIGNVPNAIMAAYYAQRAAAGLILTEGTAPSPNGLGYPRIPGLYSPEQIAGWRQVGEAVHQAGGRIIVQLMHTGRVGHPNNLPAGARLLGVSDLAAPGTMYTDAAGPQAHPAPDVMTEGDIRTAIDEFTHSAKSAIAAGLDGIELHGANGYLIEQFLNTASNQRTDGYGGSVANRARFALEVARATADAIGGDRVGIRLSAYGVFNGMTPDPATDELYGHLATELGKLGLAHLHVVDHSSMGAPPVSDALKATLRKNFRGAYILSGGYDRARAEADLAAGKGDLVAFGRPYLANPRLVDKLEHGGALVDADPTTFYTPGEKGYLDYPA